ncbi:TPA: hypothetical protein EYP66_02395 [Candidatus Poribacteria bacterium]|nr:hypothetical protein [Candidatus Poribacteria bacterium]
MRENYVGCVSVGVLRLYAAAIIPGFLLAGFYMIGLSNLFKTTKPLYNKGFRVFVGWRAGYNA